MSTGRIKMCLYWGGKIVTDSNGSVTYDPKAAKKLLVVRRISYDELVQKIYGYMNVDSNIVKLRLTLRVPMFVSGNVCSIIGQPLEDDDGMEMMYEISETLSHYVAEIYIEEDAIEVDFGENVEHVAPISGPTSEQQYEVNDTELQQSDYTGHTNYVSSGPTSYSVLRPSHCAQYIHDPVTVDYSAPGPTSQSLPQDSDAVERLVHIQGTVVNNPDEGNDNSDYVGDDSDEEEISPDEDGDDSEDDAPVTVIGTGRNAANRYFDNPVTSQYANQLTHFYEDLGDAMSVDVTARGDSEHVNVWNRETGDIRIGMFFESKQQILEACRLWHISRSREYIVHESRKNNWYAKCKLEHSPTPCKWQIRAVLKKRLQMWQITRWVESHSCLRASTRNDHRHVSVKIIASKILQHIRESPEFSVKQIQAVIKEVLSVDVTYKKAWYARRAAIDMIYGKAC